MSMNVGQLREAIAAFPDHWPVVIEHEVARVDAYVESNVDYIDVVDVQQAGLKGHGNLVAVLPRRPGQYNT